MGNARLARDIDERDAMEIIYLRRGQPDATWHGVQGLVEIGKEAPQRLVKRGNRDGNFLETHVRVDKDIEDRHGNQPTRVSMGSIRTSMPLLRTGASARSSASVPPGTWPSMVMT